MASNLWVKSWATKAGIKPAAQDPVDIVIKKHLKKKSTLIASGESALKSGDDIKAWYDISSAMFCAEEILSSGKNPKNIDFNKELPKEELQLYPVIVDLETKIGFTLLSIFHSRDLLEIIKESTTNTKSLAQLNYVLDEILEPISAIATKDRMNANTFTTTKLFLLGKAILLKERNNQGHDKEKLVKLENEFRTTVRAELIRTLFKDPIIKYPSAQYTGLCELGVDVKKAQQSFNGKTFDEWKTFPVDNPEQKPINKKTALQPKDINRLLNTLYKPVIPPPQPSFPTKAVIALNNGNQIANGPGSPASETITVDNHQNGLQPLPPITDDQIKNAKDSLKILFTGLVKKNEEITDIDTAVNDVFSNLGERAKAKLNKLGIDKSILVAALYSLQAKQKEQVWQLSTLDQPCSGAIKDKILEGLEKLDKICGSGDKKMFVTDVTDKHINETDEKVQNVYGKLLQNIDNRHLTYELFKLKLHTALKDEVIGEKELEIRLAKLGLTQKEHYIFVAYHEASEELSKKGNLESIGETTRRKLKGKVNLDDVVDMDFTLKTLQILYPELMEVKQSAKTIQIDSLNTLKIKSVEYPPTVLNYLKLARALKINFSEGELPDRNEIRRLYQRKQSNQLNDHFVDAYAVFVPKKGSLLRPLHLTATYDNDKKGTIKIENREQLKEYLSKFPIKLTALQT